MPPFNRRHFGKLIAGAAAAIPLTAAVSQTAAAIDEKPGAAAAATPLTPEQMEQYRKALPDKRKELDKLHGFNLGYGYEPDFVTRQLGGATSRVGAGCGQSKPDRSDQRERSASSERSYRFRAVGPGHAPVANRTRVRKAAPARVRPKVKNG